MHDGFVHPVLYPERAGACSSGKTVTAGTVEGARAILPDPAHITAIAVAKRPAAALA